MPQYNNNEKKFGLAFPLQIEKGSLKACTYEESIKQSLRTLLLTARGERVMRPGFGSGLYAYLFESIDATTASLIKHEIVKTIEYFEPRVELLDVKVNSKPQEPGVIHIELNYYINPTSTTDQLTLTVKPTRS
jgi:phage baseplate assembly protein W